MAPPGDKGWWVVGAAFWRESWLWGAAPLRLAGTPPPAPCLAPRPAAAGVQQRRPSVEQLGQRRRGERVLCWPGAQQQRGAGPAGRHAGLHRPAARQPGAPAVAVPAPTAPEPAAARAQPWWVARMAAPPCRPTVLPAARRLSRSLHQPLAQRPPGAGTSMTPPPGIEHDATTPELGAVGVAASQDPDEMARVSQPAPTNRPTPAPPGPGGACGLCSRATGCPPPPPLSPLPPVAPPSSPRLRARPHKTWAPARA